MLAGSVPFWRKTLYCAVRQQRVSVAPAQYGYLFLIEHGAPLGFGFLNGRHISREMCSCREREVSGGFARCTYYTPVGGAGSQHMHVGKESLMSAETSAFCQLRHRPRGAITDALKHVVQCYFIIRIAVDERRSVQ